MSNPFDFSSFFKQFDPQDALQQMQNQFQSQVQAAMSAFQPKQPDFDFDAFTEAQKKNFEALIASQQKSMEFAQNMLAKQTELVQGAIAEATEAGKTLADNLNDPQELAKQQGALMQAALDKALASANEMSEMVSKAQEEISGVISERVKAGLEEIKKASS